MARQRLAHDVLVRRRGRVLGILPGEVHRPPGHGGELLVADGSRPAKLFGLVGQMPENSADQC
jgi:hypothetical protein